MRTLLILLSLFLSCLLKAQDSIPNCHAQFSIGASFLTIRDQQIRYTLQLNNRPAYEVLTRKNYSSFYTLLLHPKLNLKRWKAQGLGLNLSFPVSISFYGETRTNTSPIVYKKRDYFLSNIPFLLELAIGQKAYCGCKNKMRMGGFVSLGGSFIYGAGKIGRFKSTAPYGMLGFRQGIGRFTLELSAGSSVVGTHHYPDVLTETDLPITKIYPPQKIAHTISLSVYFKK